MSGSGLLKKALPVVLGLILIIIIGVVVTNVNAGKKITPSVSDSDKIYLSIEEDGKTYSLTRGEMYEELKSSVGSSSLINVVNKMILKVEKNSEGVSFYDAVKDEDIVKEIDEAIYGEDGKDELTQEEIDEKVEDFLDSMFTSYGLKADDIYGAEIKEHYQLVLAKEEYAKAQLDKAISEADEKAANDSDYDPYFDEDEIDDYYSDNYYKEYWGIIVPFVTKDEAYNALQQLGVVIDKSNDVWCHAKVEEEKDSDENGTGVFKVEKGEPLTPAEVVDTFIKLYNLVYGYKSENGPMISEGKDYKVVDVKAEVDALKELVTKLYDDYKNDVTITETMTNVETAILALETKLAEHKYSTAKITAALETIKTSLQKVADNTDPDKSENLKKDVLDDIESLKTVVNKLNEKGYIFDLTVEDSPLHYDHETLSDYNSTLPNKFNNKYVVYNPFATESTNGSINDKSDDWYTNDDVLGLSSNAYYVVVLKIGEIAIPSLDSVREEIIEKLKEEELTSSYIETKIAQLRENYSLVIYDEEIESQYNSSMEQYNIDRESTDDESKDNVAQFTQYTYKKAEVSSKKQFKSVRKANDGIYVYNNGIYEEVKKYQENQIYYTREKVETVKLSANDLYKVMDKAYGMGMAISKLSYDRFLYSVKYNEYKDMVTGEWKDEEKRAELIEEIETTRLNFLAGGYTSYGYDPTTMSWKDFMKGLYGVDNEKELADSLLYSDIISEYTASLNYLAETDEDGKLVNTNYKELVESKLWKLYQDKMNASIEEYFSATGVHFLISRYEDPAKSTGTSATPLDPKEWTDEQKELAKELIADVTKYLQVAKGDYETILTEIANAFKACPYYVDGNAPVIYDEDGNVVDYKLTKAEVTIDIAKYKTAGLYVKFEDLDTFANGTMVETFNDAVKAIWDKDIADKVYDRITVLEDPIETEFGYHLYINLASNKLVTYESNEIKVNEDGTWEYVYVDDEETEHKTIETMFPQLYEVMLYLEDNAHEDLTSGATTAITTYYSPIASEISGSYMTSICQYTDILDLLTDSSLTDQASYTQEDLVRLININLDSWYENNLKYLKLGDEKVIKEGK